MSHHEKTDIDETDCLEAIDNLYAYLDGEIADPEVVARFETHLRHCHSCCSRTKMEKAFNQRLETAAMTDATASLQNRLRNLIDSL